MEAEASETVFEVESTSDLGEALVDSDNGGQETAPITGPTSTTPFEGLFQASFFGRAALPLLTSEPSTAEELSGGGDGEAVFRGEKSENVVCSGWEVVDDAEDEDREWFAAEIDSDSPRATSLRTTWAHGDGRFFRRNCGLPMLSPPSTAAGTVGLEGESAAVAIPNVTSELRNQNRRQIDLSIIYRTESPTENN